jgi:hypothetical protein
MVEMKQDDVENGCLDFDEARSCLVPDGKSELGRRRDAGSGAQSGALVGSATSNFTFFSRHHPDLPQAEHGLIPLAENKHLDMRETSVSGDIFNGGS